MQKITPAAAARDLAEILSSVEVDDQEYLIERDGKPIARLVPISGSEERRSNLGAPRARRPVRPVTIRTAMTAAVHASRSVNRRHVRA